MSKGLASVKTLTAKQIADKWKLPLEVVAKKITAGIKIEKEHTKSLKQANEIARDHLAERPDYYEKLGKMEKTKVVKEDMTNVAGVTPRVSTQNTRQMVQGGRTPPSGTPNVTVTSDPNTDHRTISGDSSAASKYEMDKMRHFDLNKTVASGGSFITSNAPRKDITSAADDMEARRQAGTLGPKDPEVEKVVRNYRYGETGSGSETTPSNMSSDITSGAKSTPTPGSVRTTPEIQKISDTMMSRRGGNVQEENATGAVRGLGFVTGDPGVSAVDQYINTNALANDPLNGARLDFMSRIHNKLHNKLGFNHYNPKDKVHFNKELVERKLNELGEYDNKGGTVGAEGLTDTAPLVHKRRSVKEQGYGIRSYTEKPLVEKKPIPDAMPTASDRGIYEVSSDTVSNYVTGAASQLASGEIADNRKKEQNRITGITTGIQKLHPDMYPGAAKVPVPVNEISDTLVGKVSNAAFFKYNNRPLKPTTQRRIKVAQLRDPEEIKKENKRREKETKMDNKERINEALDCILDDNLAEMKDNLLAALQEKAMEKLEERKKEIAANYFAE